jgi:KDO2-lipid IV(A) lauroyltransferase
MIKKALFLIGIFFLRLLSYLPLTVLYIISDFLFVILYHVVKYRRKVVFDNLKNSFPNKAETDLKEIEKEFFKYLADLMVEIIKLITASEKDILKRFTVTNLDLIKKFEDQNQSYLMAASHYGNWEWNTIISPLAFKAQTLIIYKELHNLTFDTFLKNVREKSGVKMVTMKSSFRAIIKHKNELTNTVFAADQTPAGTEAQILIDFLNQKTLVFYGLEKSAKATNYPVIFCDLKRVKRGYYAGDFKLITDNPALEPENEITKKYFALLENTINQEPAYWLWSHKRWKYSPKNSHE